MQRAIDRLSEENRTLRQENALLASDLARSLQPSTAAASAASAASAAAGGVVGAAAICAPSIYQYAREKQSESDVANLLHMNAALGNDHGLPPQPAPPQQTAAARAAASAVDAVRGISLPASAADAAPPSAEEIARLRVLYDGLTAALADKNQLVVALQQRVVERDGAIEELLRAAHTQRMRLGALESLSKSFEEFTEEIQREKSALVSVFGRNQAACALIGPSPLQLFLPFPTILRS